MLRPLFFALLVVFCCLSGAWGQSLDGETFTKKRVSASPDGEKLVEFVREGESFEQWTKLIGFRLLHAPRIDNDPEKMVGALAEVLLKRSPETYAHARMVPETGDAFIVFFNVSDDKSYVELNEIRFWKTVDGGAMASVRFAHRTPKSGWSNLDGKQLGEMRKSWLSQLLKVEKADVLEALSEQPAGQ